MRYISGILAGSLAVLMPAVASAADDAPGSIVVEAERKVQEAAVRAKAREVSGRLVAGRPVARFFDPMCLAIGGVNPALADGFALRIMENARQADVPVAEGDCQPNALVVFAKDGREQLKKVREEHRWIFSGLGESKIKKILNSRDPAFAWQVTELRGVDGRRFNSELGGGTPVNTQYQTGRLNQPVRMDIRGAVVLFDSAAVEGLSAIQLADYASMRLLVPTQEVETVDSDGMETVMTMFLDKESAPTELTEFDFAYLRGIYQLRPNAPSLAVYGATARSFRRQSID